MTNTLFQVPQTQTKPVASIVDQVKSAKKNKLAAISGLCLGGVVPISTYVLVHQEVTANPYLWIIATGGLIYSAKTVFDWASVAFRNGAKALGFVVLIEGVMTFSHTPALSIGALAYLVAINGLATGCNIANDAKEATAAKRKGKRGG